MNRHNAHVTPRMRPLPPKRSLTVSILDVGTCKVVCLIAELHPLKSGEAVKGRTHAIKVTGIGHQASRGLKGGAIVDLEAAEQKRQTFESKNAAFMPGTGSLTGKLEGARSALGGLPAGAC